MRITVIDVEHDDPGAAIAAINAALGRTNGTTRTLAIEAPKPPDEVEIVELSAPLAETWNWLVANDRHGGLALDEMARALKIKHGTANYRVSALIRQGLAHRVKRGYIRAGES